MEEEWKEYYNNGLAYCRTALAVRSRKEKFGTVVLYNLIGLALEGMLTGMIMKNGEMPEHSGVGSMLRILKEKYDMPLSFKEESRFFNKFMNFCSLDVTPQEDPSADDIDRMLDFLVRVKEWGVGKIGISVF